MVKYINTYKTIKTWKSISIINWHWGTKAKVAKRISYPYSFSSKRWMLKSDKRIYIQSNI